MKFARSNIMIALLAVSLAGCAAVRAHKGAVLDPQLASAIEPGVDNKASVQKVLGAPTITGTFNPNDWYYVSADTRQVAFRNPRTSKETVIHIRFDAAGNVASIQRSGKELALNVDPSNRVTPTLGRKRSFFEEVFGGIGSVNSAGLPTGGDQGP
jgi:outer membrane protein assembly factor BamE (lipoprotein component of BamABCDE complex)